MIFQKSVAPMLEEEDEAVVTADDDDDDDTPPKSNYPNVKTLIWKLKKKVMFYNIKFEVKKRF